MSVSKERVIKERPDVALAIVERLKTQLDQTNKEIQKLQAKCDEWVSVEDRLPEDSVFVDVYIKSHGNPDFGRRKISVLFRDNEFDVSIRRYTEEYVSHWKRLTTPS